MAKERRKKHVQQARRLGLQTHALAKAYNTIEAPAISKRLNLLWGNLDTQMHWKYSELGFMGSMSASASERARFDPNSQWRRVAQCMLHSGIYYLVGLAVTPFNSDASTLLAGAELGERDGPHTTLDDARTIVQHKRGAFPDDEGVGTTLYMWHMMFWCYLSRHLLDCKTKSLLPFGAMGHVVEGKPLNMPSSLPPIDPGLSSDGVSRLRKSQVSSDNIRIGLRSCWPSSDNNNGEQGRQ